MTNLIDHFDQLAALENDQLSLNQTMDLWVRGEEVAVYEVEMPEVPERKWIDMIPWLLEDQLLRPAEELHFVIGPQVSNGKALVYVVTKECMNRWVMMSESKSIRAQSFAPDYLALPIEDGYWTLTVLGSRLVVRTGQYTGFASELSLGWQLLGLQLSQTEHIRIAALVSDEQVIPDNWRDRVQAQKGELNWGFLELPSVNLLTGEYRPTVTKEIKPWLPSLGLSGAALVMLLVYMLIQSYQWEKDIAVLDEGIAQAYQDLFNEAWRGPRSSVRAVADARMQLLQHQYFSLQSTPVAELRALDSGLSSCAGCDVQLIKQENDFVNITLKPVDNLQSKLSALQGMELNWGNPDGDGVVRLKVTSEAGGG